MDVQERGAGGTLKSLISGVREWITVVAAYEPYNGLADRSRNRSRELDARRLREQTRLLWPDGVPVSGMSSGEQARRN